MAGWRCRAAVLRVPGSWVDGWWSGWKRNGRDASEDGDDLIDPGPGWGNPKVSSSGAVGEPGGHVQQPVAQGFGLCGGQLAGQGQRPQPGNEIGGDRGGHQPGLVDAEFSGGESARINNLLRWVAGICSIAAPRTSMSSAAVLAPALPGRRTAASSSVVLSHHAPSG